MTADDRSACQLRVLDFNPFVVNKERQRIEAAKRAPAVGFCEERTYGKVGGIGLSGKGKEKEVELERPCVRPAEGDADEVDVGDGNAVAGPSTSAGKNAEERVMVRLFDAPGRMAGGKLWAEAVHSTLPFRSVTTKATFPYANVVIDEERIGGILVSGLADDVVSGDSFLLTSTVVTGERARRFRRTGRMDDVISCYRLGSGSCCTRFLLSFLGFDTTFTVLFSLSLSPYCNSPADHTIFILV